MYPNVRFFNHDSRNPDRLRCIGTFSEDDTRTHYNPPEVGPGHCADLRETEGVWARNFAHILVRGGGIWWADGGSPYRQQDPTWAYLTTLTGAYQAAGPSATVSAGVNRVQVLSGQCTSQQP